MKPIMIYITSALLFLLIGRTYYRYALKKKILDHPSHRSSHRNPTVRGGGIIFVAGVLIAYFLYLYPAYPYFLTGFLILSATGFADDKLQLSPKIRFPLQLVSLVLILYDAGLWTSEWPLWLKAIVLIVSLGFINAYNFMDGINGITASYSAALVFLFLWLNRETRLWPEPFFVLLLISIMVFGHFNVRKKALMFAGDVGTMALSAVLLFVGLRFALELQSPVLLLLVGVYGTDSALTIIRRIFMGENILAAHRHHAYQKLVDRCGWSHLQVSLAYGLIQWLTGLAVILGQWYKKPLNWQWLAVSGGLAIFVLIYYFIIHRACEDRI